MRKKIPTYVPCIWNFTNGCRSRTRHVHGIFSLELGSWSELRGILNAPFSEVCSLDQKFCRQCGAHPCLRLSPLWKCLSIRCVLEMGWCQKRPLSLVPWTSFSLYGVVFLPTINPPEDSWLLGHPLIFLLVCVIDFHKCFIPSSAKSLHFDPYKGAKFCSVCTFAPPEHILCH